MKVILSLPSSGRLRITFIRYTQNNLHQVRSELVNFEEAFDKDEPEDSDGESDNEEEDGYYDTNEEDVFDHLPTHSRCYAHTLQLVVKDGLKNCNAHLITMWLNAKIHPTFQEISNF
jgi:hypothetical protein